MMTRWHDDKLTRMQDMPRDAASWTRTRSQDDMLTCWYVDMLTCWHVDMLTCWHVSGFKIVRIKRAKEIWAVVVEKVHKETFSWGVGPRIRYLGFPALRDSLRRQSNTWSKSTKAVPLAVAFFPLWLSCLAIWPSDHSGLKWGVRLGVSQIWP